MSEENEKYLIEAHSFMSRPEKLTTETDKPFNLLTKTNEQIWDIVVFVMMYWARGRYVSHYVEEVFILEHSLKRIETGTVQYWLHIKYLTK